MEERVVLEMEAMFIKPREIAGRTILRQELAPYTGNHPSFREKSKISINASQKIGIDMPIKETIMLVLSIHVFCLTAASIPSGKAKSRDTIAATSVRANV